MFLCLTFLKKLQIKRVKKWKVIKDPRKVDPRVAKVIKKFKVEIIEVYK